MEWFEFILCFGSHALVLSLFDNHDLMSNPYITAASLLLPLLFYRLLSSPMIVTRCLSDVCPPPPLSLPSQQIPTILLLRFKQLHSPALPRNTCAAHLRL
jgi:hypothetical protein